MNKIKFFMNAFLCVTLVSLTACNNTSESDDLADGKIINGITADGACAHPFAVSATGKKVYFSKGNLQYNPSSNTWRFAENQYDCIGDDDYYGWSDLFGPSLNIPYSKWGLNNPSSALSENGWEFKDWGNNAISNGGNHSYRWRTLTLEEWRYMINVTVHAPATVYGVAGLILLPLDWKKCPKGLTFETDAENYTTNTYSHSQWLSLQSAGAVFLPAAGYIDEEVSSVGFGGYYWTSHSSDYSTYYYHYFIHFNSSSINTDNTSYLTKRYSVRLVQDAR